MKPKFQKALAVLLLLAVWQAAAMALNQKLLLASPLTVVARLFKLIGEKLFLQSVWFSFTRITLGFLMGFLAGSLLAVAAGRFQWLEILLQPVMSAIKSVPVASFIILALIWLSSAQLSCFIAFLMVLPVIYANLLSGIRAIDGKMLQMADIFRISRARRFLYIALPALKPYLISACRTALGLSWKAGIAAEVIGIPSGSIGEKLYNAKAYLNTADLFAWTVVIVAVSVLFEKCFIALITLAYRKLEQA